MAERSEDQLKTSISNDLADNNAGNISAKDVRDNLFNTVDSIIPIVQSGINTSNPFTCNVKIGAGGEGCGILEVTSGVKFSDGTVQTEAFAGVAGIPHSGLDGLNAVGADDHLMYVHIDGRRDITGNMGLRSWVSESGNANQGFNFDDDNGLVHVGNVSDKPTTFKFDRDSSRLDSAKGAARAWVRWTATSGVSNSGVAVVSSFNVHSVRRLGAGQFHINFPSGTFSDNDFVSVGNSSGRGDGDTPDAFDMNVVGMVVTSGNDSPTLRGVSYYVKNLSNQYVNAAVNSIVVYGDGTGTTSTSTATVVDDLGLS